MKTQKKSPLIALLLAAGVLVGAIAAGLWLSRPVPLIDLTGEQTAPNYLELFVTRHGQTNRYQIWEEATLAPLTALLRDTTVAPDSLLPARRVEYETQYRLHLYSLPTKEPQTVREVTLTGLGKLYDTHWRPYSISPEKETKILSELEALIANEGS